MPTLDSRILKDFLAQLSDSGHVSVKLVDSLGSMLDKARLPKPEEVAALYAPDEENRTA